MESNKKICLLFDREITEENRFKDSLVGIYDTEHINDACKDIMNNKNHSAYFFYVEKNKTFN